ncbi:MAG: flagellar brake protein [Burkholderiaceae bacterium]|nr:flagellar brake protein [Burkholderiaceae bacterium]
MSLISVAREELTIGQPVRWALYDQDHNILLDKGKVIADASQLDAICERKPFRDLSLTGQDKGGAGNQRLAAAEQGKTEAAFGFLDMKLRVGDRIQLQPPASMGPDRYVVKLIGYVENLSVLVTPPIANGMRVPVMDGDIVVARVFTSQTAFAFNCTIDKVVKVPFDYLHLSYPAVVQGAVIRKSARIRTNIIASIARGNAAPADDKYPAIITNVSADGALICTREPLDRKAANIVLSFRINLHDVDAHLSIKAVVRNVQVDETKNDGDPLKYQHGVQFMHTQPTDNMILQSLIYQQMIEQPHTLT